MTFNDVFVKLCLHFLEKTTFHAYEKLLIKKKTVFQVGILKPLF